MATAIVPPLHPKELAWARRLASLVAELLMRA
jgi:hypothetical protein